VNDGGAYGTHAPSIELRLGLRKVARDRAFVAGVQIH
jgi:hypothetical protein